MPRMRGLLLRQFGYPLRFPQRVGRQTVGLLEDDRGQLKRDTGARPFQIGPADGDGRWPMRPPAMDSR